eukprot:419350-Amphidinium_carterae.1
MHFVTAFRVDVPSPTTLVISLAVTLLQEASLFATFCNAQRTEARAQLEGSDSSLERFHGTFLNKFLVLTLGLALPSNAEQCNAAIELVSTMSLEEPVGSPFAK